jgi:hypothetical protein
MVRTDQQIICTDFWGNATNGKCPGLHIRPIRAAREEVHDLSAAQRFSWLWVDFVRGKTEQIGRGGFL